MGKTFKLLALFMALILMLTACGGGASPAGSAASTDPAASGESQAEGQSASAELGKVVYLTPGTLGDNAFSDSVNSGIIKIKEDYNAQTTVIENSFDASKYSQSVEAAFQWGPNVLFCDAYGMEDLLKNYADQYPDVNVVNLDFELKNDGQTISSVTFIQEEGAFMAGVAAAIVTTSDLEFANSEKIVGAMGGQDIPVIQSFIHGFKQGVAYVDPEIEVLVNFAGTFNDPSVGKQATKQLYAQGADIVFQIAGLTGNGALEAASEEGKYVIGVDSNQNPLYPGHVVTSMVKDLGGAVHDVYQKMLDGTYEKNHTYEYGIGPNGVYLAIDDFSKQILSEDMLKQISDIEQKIISGEIKVERYQK